MLSFENVTRRFGGKTALHNISLHIPAGETVGLIGASGAGKTTLLKLSCGFLAPTSGRIRTMLREPIQSRKEIGYELGVYISGKSLLQANDTVGENFGILKSIYHIPATQYIADYHALSERLGFAGYADTLVSELSLGQRTRAELGAVFLHRPRLIILDEPTVGLDANAKKSLYELLTERNRAGATVFLSSHNMSEVSEICSRIALLHEGRLLRYGSERQLRNAVLPIDTMTLTIAGIIPDFEDLPIKRFILDGDKITIFYNANHINPAEILRLVTSQTTISEVSIVKSGLEDIIFQSVKQEDGNGQLYRGQEHKQSF